jgi:benzoylformate decarboxylase
LNIAELLIQTLELAGVRTIFGNPGTTEIPLVRACERRPGLNFAVTLSEVSAVPMADGYARASRSLGAVILHVAPGLGNGMGGLFTASVARTPLLALIGGQDRRFLHTQPILSGPLEQMAATVTKSVLSLTSQYDAAANIRRAIRTALTPPFGPVALICPPDLLEEEIDAEPAHVNPPSLAGLPAEHAQRYAEILANAAHPALIAAEDVHWNDAGDALTALATTLAAPVYIAPYTGILPMASRSVHYAGYLPPSHKQIAERLAPHDVVLFVGGVGMRTTLYSEGSLRQRKLWIGNAPDVVASEGEYEVATIADTRIAVEQIVRALGNAGHTRPAVTTSLRLPVVVPAEEPDMFHPSRAVSSLLAAFPSAIWIDESGLSTSDVRQWMQLNAGEYLIHGSGGIGWGLAASVGAALAHPDRQVVAIVGDGSMLYASEALWTAAHNQTNLLVVILANRRYATLNAAATRLAGGPLEAFTIEPPVLDFRGLAALYSWTYVAASTECELKTFIASHTGRATGNTMLELTIDPAITPVTASRHF